MLNPPEAKRILEAALLASQEPLGLTDLKRLFDGQLGVDTLRPLLAELAEEWQGRAVELVSLASGWRFQTRAQTGPESSPTTATPTATRAPTTITEEMALVTAISGVCKAGVTLQTT